jgi:WD40 repeat protein
VVWDANTGEPTQELTTGTFLLISLSLSSPDRFFLAGAYPWVLDAVTLGDTGLWREARMGDFLAGPFSGATSATTTQDGKLLLVGSAFGVVSIFDVVTGERRTTASLHTGAVTSIAIDNEKRTAMSCGHDGRLVAWLLDNPTTVRTVAEVRGAIGPVVFVKDSTFAWGLEQGAVGFVIGGQVVQEAGVRVHSREVTVLAPLLDGNVLLSAAMDGRVCVWSPRENTLIAELALDRPITCGAVAPNRATVAIGDEAGSVHFLRFAGIVEP